MRIAATEFSLNTESLDIYISGCNPPHCENCHNPELWSFTVGEDYNQDMFNSIKEKVAIFSDLIKNIMIFGGEPVDSPLNELLLFLTDLNLLEKCIWLFTRYDVNEIPVSVISKCDYIKTGRYISNRNTNDNIYFGVKLASSNQCIYQL